MRGCLVMKAGKRWGEAGGEIAKGRKENVGGDGDVSSLDYGDEFTGVYLCQNLTNCNSKFEYVPFVVCRLLSQ